MPSEAKRGLKRIAANYLGLVSTLVLGVAIVPILVAWLGLEGYGLISLVGVSVGLAGVFRELTDQSMIRELGAAMHGGDDEVFREYYSSAYVVAGGMAVLTAAIFAVIIVFIDLLKIPPEWIGAARWVVAGQGTFAVLLVLLAPAFSMYRVKEQFGWYAFWRFALRATALGSAAILAWWLNVRETVVAIKWHGILWSVLLALVLFVAVGAIVASDRRLIPSRRRIRRDAVRQVLHTFSWGSVSHVGVNLHRLLAALLMNLAFGVFGNAVFDIAHRLVAYVRMATTGVTFGLDAASARLSSGERPEAVRDLVRHASRLQSFVALPAALAVFVLARPLLELWVGRSVEDPARSIPLAVSIVQILAFALASRAISDGWLVILYGAGYVRRYAPLVLAGGIVSPVAGGLLLWALPESIVFNAPAIGYAVVMTAVHLLMLPAIGAACLGVRYRDMLAPLARPAMITALCAPLLVVPSMLLPDWSPLTMLGACAGFGIVYAIASWMIVLTPDERRRFSGAARRRLVARLP